MKQTIAMFNGNATTMRFKEDYSWFKSMVDIGRNFECTHMYCDTEMKCTVGPQYIMYYHEWDQQ